MLTSRKPGGRPYAFKQPALSRQRGSMLVIAIFVIVVMALLGLAMTRLLSASSDAVVTEVYGLRALNAARSGLEAKIYQVFPTEALAVADCEGSVLDSSLDFPGFDDAPGFANCSFVSSCGETSYDGGAITYYRFTSVGQCQVGDMNVSRTLSVDARL